MLATARVGLRREPLNSFCTAISDNTGYFYMNSSVLSKVFGSVQCLPELIASRRGGCKKVVKIKPAQFWSLLSHKNFDFVSRQANSYACVLHLKVSSLLMHREKVKLVEMLRSTTTPLPRLTTTRPLVTEVRMGRSPPRLWQATEWQTRRYR